MEQRRSRRRYVNSKTYGSVPLARAVLMAAGVSLTNRVCHHKDGDYTNDKRSNLEAVSWTYHNRIHRCWKIIKGVWHKRCGKCGRMMSVNNFYKRITSLEKGLYAPYCKVCSRAYAKMEYRIKCELCG